MNLARRAVRAYPRTPLASRELTNHLRRAWMAKVSEMGDKWLLHPSNFVQRKQAGIALPDMMVLICVIALSAIAWFWGI